MPSKDKKTTAKTAVQAKAATAVASTPAAAPVPTAAPAAAAKNARGIRVKSRIAGFRRAGIAWAAEPVDMLLGSLSNAQLAQIRAEPMLVVDDITIPVAE